MIAHVTNVCQMCKNGAFVLFDTTLYYGVKKLEVD